MISNLAMSETPPLPPAFGPPINSGLSEISGQSANAVRDETFPHDLDISCLADQGASTCASRVTQATTQLFKCLSRLLLQMLRLLDVCRIQSPFSCLASTSLAGTDESSQSKLWVLQRSLSVRRLKCKKQLCQECCYQPLRLLQLFESLYKELRAPNLQDDSSLYHHVAFHSMFPRETLRVEKGAVLTDLFQTQACLSLTYQKKRNHCNRCSPASSARLRVWCPGSSIRGTGTKRINFELHNFWPLSGSTRDRTRNEGKWGRLWGCAGASRPTCMKLWAPLKRQICSGTVYAPAQFAQIGPQTRRFCKQLWSHWHIGRQVHWWDPWLHYSLRW